MILYIIMIKQNEDSLYEEVSRNSRSKNLTYILFYFLKFKKFR